MPLWMARRVAARLSSSVCATLLCSRHRPRRRRQLEEVLRAEQGCAVRARDVRRRAAVADDLRHDFDEPDQRENSDP